MAYSTLILSFFTIFVIIKLSWCELTPFYDLGLGQKKFFDVGKALKLECKVAKDGEQASEIKWSKADDSNFDKNAENKYTISVNGGTSTLEIHKTDGKDDGKYSCSYKGKTYSYDVIANVLVKIKPTTDVSVVEGESLTLKCVGVGTKLQINWVYDENITDVHFETDNDIANATIEIKNVQKSYRGSYTCEGRHDASVGVNTVVNSTAYVRVKDKYAALWPFILICIEVFILCAIILIYEKHRTHVEVEDSETEPDQKNGKN